MPLVFSTGHYEQTHTIFATLGTRSSSDEDWRIGTFVPSRALLHGDGEDGLTAATTT